ncbi:hypothetical protein G3I19_00310 [Streptomyces sp. SID10853]|uniref:hypothetical protein n=1 Tax=Streptomyces sp. SID10853 TaxID=2706028 RepID=UPI0013C2352F|nr:hypothetical protein [Streptomyces sp. SID10853]NDZ76987.1 hypothetical protein [Streptomyces sp. SID10853]
MARQLKGGGVERFFSSKRTWSGGGSYLHFIAQLDDPKYVEFAKAYEGLLSTYGERVGTVPPKWLHWTVQGVHHGLTRDQVERVVESVRKDLAWNGTSATVQMGPVWPGPSALTVAMYPENKLAALTARVRTAVSAVEGIRLRPAGPRAWPHSTVAYYRSEDVHDAAFNRQVRDSRPDRFEITIDRLHAVYMRQDVDRGYYTWNHLAALTLCGTPKLTVGERLAELAAQASREGDERWQAAWERVCAIVTPGLGSQEIPHNGASDVDGSSALAIAFYLLACERKAPVAALTRDDVEELAGNWTDFSQPRMQDRWTRRLEALGHRMDDPDDPVMVRWRALSLEYPEPDPDNPDASTYRVGHAGESGLRPLLAELRDRLRF